jgi:hypothetical protein
MLSDLIPLDMPMLECDTDHSILIVFEFEIQQWGRVHYYSQYEIITLPYEQMHEVI